MNTLDKSNHTQNTWWIILVVALIVIAGLWIATAPSLNFITLAMIFSLLVIATGVFEVYFSATNRFFLKDWVWFLAGGLVKTIAGAMLFFYL